MLTEAELKKVHDELAKFKKSTELCCGCSDDTKVVFMGGYQAALSSCIADIRVAHDAISKWAQADLLVKDLPEDAYLHPGKIDNLTDALKLRRDAEYKLHELALSLLSKYKVPEEEVIRKALMGEDHE